MKKFKITESITNRNECYLNLFLKDINKIPRISAEREIELSSRIKSGNKEAVNELVLANLRFVITIAKQYQFNGLPLVDLIQEGIFGLIEAANKYDGSLGIRFVSYASWWIKNAIIQALTFTSRTVRVPANQVMNLSKISKCIKKFEQENERTPCSIEMEDDTQLSSQQIDTTIQAFIKPTSLTAPTSENGEYCLLDVIPSDKIDTNLDSDKVLVEELLESLPNRDRDVIRLFFGIGTKEMTLEEIGTRFGIVKERIRQIIVTSLEKLREYSKENDILSQ